MPAVVNVLGDLTGLLRTYTRAFLSQGVGVIGLAWCLVQGLPLAAAALAVLVLVDQSIFLRGRWRAPGADRPIHLALNGWCLAVSGLDILLFLATALRSLGLQDGAGRPVVDPLSCLAAVVAAVAHADLHVAPTSGGGRMLLAGTALIGDAAALAVLAILLRRRGARD